MYYVQYAHARTANILRQIQATGAEVKDDIKLNVREPLVRQLILTLTEFPPVVVRTAETYELQRLPMYVQDLATAFHQFYAAVRVIDKGQVGQYHLQLVRAGQTVIKTTLGLMGVSAPDKM